VNIHLTRAAKACLALERDGLHPPATSGLAPYVQPAAPGATCTPPARTSVEWSYMDEEPAYGREALRRSREQKAAKRTNAPTSPKRASIQTRIRIAVNPDEQSFLEGLTRLRLRPTRCISAACEDRA
jgi:hypothetical protein